ncbi:MAG: hypothetical protein HQL24_10410, partial [Candidatus Omnitrophica bacterium]|nr:hypothetical protein [Candidatus Omnitrophota bacterium]
DVLRLRKGSMFDVKVLRNRIELIPLEISEKSFSEEDFQALDGLVREEKKKGAGKVTKEFIKNITKE